MVTREEFGKDFLWGTATAAYQIEGAAFEDGKGEGVWDRFVRIPGKTNNGETGDIACGSYHLWKEDIRLLKELGANAYRFSISWPRVIPGGFGKVNQAGLDYYSRLIDALLENSITPAITIWHGDQPQALEDLGGWANRDIIQWYGDYAEVLFKNFGDRVPIWITLNEPNCFLYYGYGTGNTAPGKTDWKLAYQAVHHALTAHGEGVRRFRASGKPGRIGITMSIDLWSAETDSPEDKEAARIAAIKNNWWLLDPLYYSKYPEEFYRDLGGQAPITKPEDFKLTSLPCDFLGWNFYGRNVVKAGGVNVGAAAKTDFTALSLNPDPDGFNEMLAILEERYGPQTIYITENGMGIKDEPVEVDGVYQDPERVQFLEQSITAISSAVKAGKDIRGYFHWTLMDNFEWTSYKARLGLYYTNFETLQRFPKASALWYRNFLKGSR